MQRFLRNGVAALAIGLFCLSGTARAAIADGAHIVNGGSTNARGWGIWIRSNGQGGFGVQGDKLKDHPFSVDAATAARFFADVKAARNAGAVGGTCMKSASFGSRTWVEWHAWQSGDLSCPIVGGAGRALASDVGAIENAAGVTAVAPSRMIRIPNEPRRAPPSGAP